MEALYAHPWRRGSVCGRCGAFVGIFHVLSNYGVNVTYCIGPSMIPTIHQNGNLVLIDTFNLGYWGSRIRREMW